MIYLDYHSTSPCDPRVIKTMKPYFFDHFYNPSSAHFGGEIVREAIEKAREQVANIIKAKPENIFFTSSATESNNLVIKSIFNSSNIIYTNSEHPSISKSFPDSYSPKIKIEKDGTIDLNKFENIIKKSKHKLSLVSIIFANNEIGNIHNIKEIGKICKKYNILLHTDATQAVGKVKIDVDEMNIWALTFSSHKIYGPKNIGALFVRNVDMIKPLISGGYQETVTSGTSSTPLMVGFGKACEILEQDGSRENKRIGKLRDLLWELLSNKLPDIYINGTIGPNRLTNNLNVTIIGIEAEAIVKGSEIYCSAGSACSSGSLEPSPVQIAIGNPFPKSAIRFGLGRFNTEQEIRYAAQRIIEIVESIRGK